MPRFPTRARAWPSAGPMSMCVHHVHMAEDAFAAIDAEVQAMAEPASELEMLQCCSAAVLSAKC